MTSLPTGQAIITSQGFPPIKIKAPLLEKTGGTSFFERLEILYGNPAKHAVAEQNRATRELGLESFPLDWINSPYAETTPEQEESE